MHIQILLLLFFVHQVINEQNKIIIGGIFEKDSGSLEAFQYAVQHINSLNQDNFILSPQIEIIESGNPFGALNSACKLLNDKVLAIVGPSEIDNIDIVQSVCDHKEIPHIISQYNYEPLQNHNIINMHPHGGTLIRAYLDIIQTLGWKSFTILYEDNDSLLRMADFYKYAKDLNYVVTINEIDEKENQIYRPSLKKARMSAETNFILDCKNENLEEILNQAQQVGLMTHHYNFLITNLDAHTIDLNKFQYSNVNFTTIRISTSDEDLIDFDVETILMIDGITMFTKALTQVPKYPTKLPHYVNCNSSKSFLYGTSLINLIKGQEFTGVSGETKFDIHGVRSTFELEVSELTEIGLEKKAFWDSKSGLTPVIKPEKKVDDDPNSLRNKTFIVITCLTEPYGMLKDAEEPLYGNDQYEGFGIDLIAELAKMEGFNYQFIIRHDKMNGAKDPFTGKWSGMIGDLIEHRADLAITDLTITSGRAEAVDFTARFMDLGISILAQKPGKAPPSFFSFADPFAVDVWLMLALAWAFVSLSLLIIGRISCEEWQNPYPCIEEPEYLQNQFTLRNSAWFTIGSLMQQGSEIAPIAISTRMIAGMWWFFVTIMVASYTANLAAFLATENPTYIFEDIKSLVAAAEMDKIRYGAKNGGATATFFTDSENELYRKVGQRMLANPKDMPPENKDGVKLAETQKYAFFMESTSIEYEIQRHCNLQQYGQLLDDKGYGIAMRKNSTYRHRLTAAILKLRESGVIAEIKRRWWEEQRGGGQCAAVEEETAAKPLNLKNVEGVFYVTVGGIGCSILFVILEMLINSFTISVKEKIPLREILKAEIKAYFDFYSNTKPVQRSASKSKSKSFSKSKSQSQELEAENENNGKTPLIEDSPRLEVAEPYGFKFATSKERFTEEKN